MTAYRFPTPPDQDRRDLILNELDRNMLVEAAAGTGKTTSMLGRMIALLRTGRCEKIRTLAAVTFTRKAAAELRGRFQIGLERAVREAEGPEKENLERALDEIEQCYIGTIHSFCARLLRERPVEARVDLGFQEIDEKVDARLRKEAWDLFVAGVVARDEGENGGLAGELEQLGLGLKDLESTFVSRFADFPDVDRWPLPERDGPLPGMEDAVREVKEYAAHMKRLAARLPFEDWGTDTLIRQYVDLPRRIAHCEDLHFAPAFMEILERFTRKPKAVHKVWMRDGEFIRQDVKNEQARWDAFREDVAAPMLLAWHELRYGPAMRILREAQRVYDDLRQERGLLNFQDLLMKAAVLLRDKPRVREYFRDRFRFLLVDEFQDTDPVQAEVMLLLTASDPEETRWRQCRPQAGALFVVGDPKQSIYRFRRADIVTYNEVKEIIGMEDGEGRRGLVVDLSANFRTSPALIDWVNRVFGPGKEIEEGSEDEPDGKKKGPMLRFPARPSDESPAYVPLLSGRVDGSQGDLAGVCSMLLPEELGNKAGAAEYEADRIARTIRQALDRSLTVTRTRKEQEEGRAPEVRPSDFMIVTRNTAHLSVYARNLQAYGVPHQVTGGSSLNEVPELKLLHICLLAVVHPDNPVSLVAALRSELFGVSDRALFAFRQACGRFNYRRRVPWEGEEGEEARAFRGIFQDVFGKLRRYDRWLEGLPPVTAMERIAGDLGLFAAAGSRPGGDLEAGSLAKALEVLRGVQHETWTTVQVADFLGRLVETEERHDGISARSAARDEVRIMNLHKVKGLEAPVVFLADSSGEASHPVTLHIDRSGEKILGYMVVQAEQKGFQRPRLAMPGGWAYLEENEQRFARAEELRLRYVAATRAGSAMIITQRQGSVGKNKSNPWKHFAGHIAPDAELADPGPVTVETGETVRLGPEEAKRAEDGIASRWEQVLRPGQAVAGAKEFALSEAGDGPEHESAQPVVLGSRYPEAGEHGVEWGTVIHSLLETAMENPAADLLRLARVVLPEHGLDADRAGAAVEVVRAVMSSDLWQRALRSEQRFVEVPFEMEKREGVSLPTLIRGAIDLVFREADGWVVVDYKTDRLRGRSPEELARHYAPQLRIYAEAWEKGTGEMPKESALYFVQEDLYVPVPAEG